ncbi:TPA: restriction endonuclease subunit S [Neisseria lactamica]|nr:restriction endonuclease subunit S [Neisseria lactamica]
MNSALKNHATYINNKVDTNEISLSQYISTDNILQNKQGIECATSLPIQGGKVTAFKKGDILLANIRPYLKKIWYAQFDGGCSADVLAIRANAETDSHFLFYALFRDDFFIHAMKGAKGTKMPRGDKAQIMEFKIPVFDLKTQQSIAAVLSALDKKIALNKQINARLEEMAKTLYDYWFVQFDFPDANGKPYKSSGGEMVFDETLKREIPKGWKPFKLSELVTLSTGKEDANFATEQGIYPFFTCSEKMLKCDVYSFDTQAILLAGNGTFSVKRFTGRFNAYQRTYVLEPKSKNLYPIVYFVIIDNVIKFTSGSRGSIIKFITRGDIEHIDVVLPNDIENMRFSEVLYTYLLQAELLEKQNYQLTQLRDFLLPMLMNGQVSVAE